MREFMPAGPPSQVAVCDVVASFDGTKARELICVAWFGRPLSNYCTPFFYNLGWSANAVTVLRTTLAFFAVAMLASGSGTLRSCAAVLYYLVFILDCVDGNLARLRDSASYWGKFTDGLSDAIYWILAPFATGIGLWINEGHEMALLAGAVTTAVALFTELVRNRLSFFREWMVSQTGPLNQNDLAACEGPSKIEQAMTSLILNGLFAVPLLLFLPNGGVYYLWAVVAVQGPASLVWMGALLFRGRVMLRRGRKSIHAVGA